MKALKMLGLAVMAGLAACDGFEDIDLDEGGGGTAGGTFTRGFVFVRGTARDVYAVDDVTGNANSPLRLTQTGGAYEPTVTRNGRQVAFVYKSGTTLELRTVATTGQGQPSTVFSSADPACASSCSLFRAPTFSPDGSFIVFTVYKGSTSQLARVSTSGGGFQFLPNGGYSQVSSASFYPDGLHVLAPAGTTRDQNKILLKVPVNGGVTDVISYNVGEALWVVSRAVVSPDGSKVAFDGRTSSGGSRIFVAPLGQTLGSVTMVTDYAGEPGVEDRFPSWRGSTELGFVSNYGGNDNIYRIGVTASRGSGNLMVPSAMEAAYGG
ncbi:MAG TPA: hypothetical protein VEY88_06905 [Archangium sp.]|nr:hypothetical protein [Archangium sp.]